MCGVNKKYCNRSYVLTNEYRNFKKILVLNIKQVYKENKTILGEVSLLIRIKTSKDIDAVIKPTLDAIQEAGVYKNDSQIIQLIIQKEKTKRLEAEKLEVFIL
jgi:Holliday junction resolvase RusA-like endonuclease